MVGVTYCKILTTKHANPTLKYRQHNLWGSVYLHVCNNTKIVSLTHNFEIENISETHDFSIIKHLCVISITPI